MITIREIPRANIDEYWKLHYEYLLSDIFPYVSFGELPTEADKEHFRSVEYRGLMEKYMDRIPDQAHMVYFIKSEIPIGCAQYVMYKSEDGKCFLMDYWVFPEHRGQATGKRCFTALNDYVKQDGGTYFQINVSNERNRNFWVQLGFVDDGVDVYGLPLMKKQIT